MSVGSMQKKAGRASFTQSEKMSDEDRKKEKAMMKKIWAAVLTLLILAMSVSAFASDTTTDTTTDTTLEANGEQGAFSAADTPEVQDKVLVLEKELKVYNLDESKVNAPTITYKYTIAPGSAGKTVTDNSNKHTANPPQSVTAPTKAGIINETSTIAVNGTNTTGTVSFSAETDELDAGTNGVKNVKLISIDFSKVVFTGAGIYRYTITESLAEGFEYDNTGVTETKISGSETHGSHVRYVDVYVKPTDRKNGNTPVFQNGLTADEWDIYGFTCFYNDEDITDSDKTEKAVKTTGFVDGTTNGSTEVLADQYYTYNLTISKTVEGDNFAKLNHQFPFTVIFTNGDVKKDIQLKTKTNGTVTDFTHEVGEPTWSGVATLLSGGSIKYIGIPMGTDVEVYETNDVAGTTYKVTTTRTNATTQTGTDDMVISGSKPTSAVSQTTKSADQSTKSVIDTTKNEDDDDAHTIAITNTLVTISPTGVVLRIAPYIMILAAGIILLLVSRRRKAVQD